MGQNGSYSPHACGEHLLIRPMAVEEKTTGGIILPESSRRRPARGTILSSGEQTKLTPGHIVYYAPFAVTEVEINGEELVVLNQESVLLYEAPA